MKSDTVKSSTITIDNDTDNQITAATTDWTISNNKLLYKFSNVNRDKIWNKNTDISFVDIDASGIKIINNEYQKYDGVELKINNKKYNYKFLLLDLDYASIKSNYLHTNYSYNDVSFGKTKEPINIYGSVIHFEPYLKPLFIHI